MDGRTRLSITTYPCHGIESRWRLDPLRIAVGSARRVDYTGLERILDRQRQKDLLSINQRQHMVFAALVVVCPENIRALVLDHNPHEAEAPKHCWRIGCPRQWHSALLQFGMLFLRQIKDERVQYHRNHGDERMVPLR